MYEAESLLKNTKLTVDELKVEMCYFFERKTEDIEQQEEDLQKFFDSRKTLFKNRSHPLKIENIGLDGPYPLQATDMLKCVDPKSFKEWLPEVEKMVYKKMADVFKMIKSSIQPSLATIVCISLLPCWTEVIQFDILAEVKNVCR
ncbi:hypothetical protein CAEBREN_21333 [Caenorhabditis brenneri]|uniref:DUF38 domain-containing protein n=1 Tax=Caenorhabditis brenneri TaxID=135651 RepID=G0PN43_CAEBE|nr:hypothetical protein CAEBREN_21333 [Caenorhabditis brenneri]